MYCWVWGVKCNSGSNRGKGWLGIILTCEAKSHCDFPKIRRPDLQNRYQHHKKLAPLYRRFCRFCSLWGLTVSLSSLFFPILMHSLGDVWHPGSGVPPQFGQVRGLLLAGRSLVVLFDWHNLTFNYQKGEINFIWSPTYGLLEAGNQLAGSVFPGYSREQCMPSRKKIVLGHPVGHFDCEAIHGHAIQV